jgi:hypothetical protein
MHQSTTIKNLLKIFSIFGAVGVSNKDTLLSHQKKMMI